MSFFSARAVFDRNHKMRGVTCLQCYTPHCSNPSTRNTHCRARRLRRVFFKIPPSLSVWICERRCTNEAVRVDSSLLLRRRPDRDYVVSQNFEKSFQWRSLDKWHFRKTSRICKSTRACRNTADLNYVKSWRGQDKVPHGPHTSTSMNLTSSSM
jgi:hypothetical protein